MLDSDVSLHQLSAQKLEVFEDEELVLEFVALAELLVLLLELLALLAPAEGAASGLAFQEHQKPMQFRSDSNRAHERSRPGSKRLAVIELNTRFGRKQLFLQLAVAVCSANLRKQFRDGTCQQKAATIRHFNQKQVESALQQRPKRWHRSVERLNRFLESLIASPPRRLRRLKQSTVDRSSFEPDVCQLVVLGGAFVQDPRRKRRKRPRCQTKLAMEVVVYAVHAFLLREEECCMEGSLQFVVPNKELKNLMDPSFQGKLLEYYYSGHRSRNFGPKIGPASHRSRQIPPVTSAVQYLALASENLLRPRQQLGTTFFGFRYDRRHLSHWRIDVTNIKSMPACCWYKDVMGGYSL